MQFLVVDREANLRKPTWTSTVSAKLWSKSVPQPSRVWVHASVCVSECVFAVLDISVFFLFLYAFWSVFLIFYYNALFVSQAKICWKRSAVKLIKNAHISAINQRGMQRVRGRGRERKPAVRGNSDQRRRRPRARLNDSSRRCHTYMLHTLTHTHTHTFVELVRCHKSPLVCHAPSREGPCLLKSH